MSLQRITLLSCLLATTPAAAQVPAFLRDVQQYQLPNGLTVVLAPDATVAHVSIETWFRAGTRYDPVGQRGTSHLFEHVFAAAPVRLDSALQADGRARVADSNAQTRRDYTRYFLKVDPEAVDWALSLQAGRMQQDADYITDDVVKRNADVVVNEGRNEAAGRTSTAPSPFWLLQRGTWGAEHPYGLIPESEASVRSVTAAQLRDWKAARSSPASTLIVVAGRFEVASMRALIEARFGRIRPGGPMSAAVERRWLPAQRELRLDQVETDVPRPRLTRRLVAPPLGDPVLEATELALRAVVLRWRERAGSALLDVPSVTLQTGQLASDLTIAADVRDAATAASSLDRAIDDVAEGRVIDLRPARDAARLAMLQKLERLGFIDSRSEQLAEATLMSGEAAEVARRLQRLGEASAASVAQAARDWIAGRGYQLLAVPEPARRVIENAGTAGRLAAPAFSPWKSVDTAIAGRRSWLTRRPTLPMARVTLIRAAESTPDSTQARLTRALADAGVSAQVSAATGNGRSSLTITAATGDLPRALATLTTLRLPAGEVVATGDLSVATLAALDRVLRALPGSTLPAPATTPLTPGTSTTAQPGRAQVRLQARWRFAVRNEADLVDAMLVRRLLSSRANTALRLDRGWSYGVNGSLRFEGATALVTLESEIQPDRARDGVSVFRDVVAAFAAGRDTIPTAATLRTQLAQEVLNTTEQLSAMDTFGRELLEGGRPSDWLERVLSQVSRLDDASLARTRTRVSLDAMELRLVGDTRWIP